MKPSVNAVYIVKKYEGFKRSAYKCPAGVWTIGYGSTMWSDGKKVFPGQIISLPDAERLLMWELENKSHALNAMNVFFNQNQFDALCSFIYNLGVGAFKRSTMYRKILVNPNDRTIRDEFMKWNKARVNGELKVLNGLTKRRKEEADLYEQI